MFRIPYDVIAIEADRLIIKMVIASSREESFHYWNLYLEYIAACGWTNQEFDQEMMRRIDKNWGDNVEKSSLWELRKASN
jgi:hypothetical protein